MDKENEIDKLLKEDNISPELRKSLEEKKRILKDDKTIEK